MAARKTNSSSVTALFEKCEDQQQGVASYLYRPVAPIPVRLKTSEKNPGAASLTQLLTDQVVSDVWLKHFKFEPTWFASGQSSDRYGKQQCLSAMPVLWGTQNVDPHASFELHVEGCTTALVLIFTNACISKSLHPLGFDQAQITMRVVVSMDPTRTIAALLSVTVNCIGQIDLHQPAPDWKASAKARLSQLLAQHVSRGERVLNALHEAQQVSVRSIKPYFSGTNTTDANQRILSIQVTRYEPDNKAIILCAPLVAADMAPSQQKMLRKMYYRPAQKLQRTVAHEVAWPNGSAKQPIELVSANSMDYWVSDSQYSKQEFSSVTPGNGTTPTRAVSVTPDKPLATFSSGMGAVNLWNHADAFFAQITRAGFSPSDYFKFAKLPIVLQVRAPIVPGPGHAGQTVNAQALMVNSAALLVRPTTKPLENTTDPDSRPMLEVRFAHGCQTIRRTSAKSARPDYLSAAIDSRWAWHEFGHVLLGASTEHMELPFCHGICDALVAIEHDSGPGLNNQHRLSRGVTFPWLPTGRRHDRTIAQGWSWLGPLHQCSVYSQRDLAMSPKGYKTEQIMSSTLFGLYQSLGGNNSDVKQREKAKDQVFALIMHTLALAGSAELVPIRTPTQFTALMLDADQLRSQGKYKKDIVAAFGRQGLLL